MSSVSGEHSWTRAKGNSHRVAVVMGAFLVVGALLSGCSSATGPSAAGGPTTMRITPLGVRITTSVNRQYCFTSLVVTSTTRGAEFGHELSVVYYKGSKASPMTVIAMDPWATLIVYADTNGSPTITWSYHGVTIDRTAIHGHFAALAAPDTEFPADFYETANFPLGVLTLSQGGRRERSFVLQPSVVRSAASLAKGSSCIGP